MKKILIIMLVFLSVSAFLGCKTEKEIIIKEKGTAKSQRDSEWTVRFENVNKNSYFHHARLWAEDSSGKIIKKDINIDINRPIKKIYQRDFDHNGTDDLLITTKPNKKGSYFNFGVFTLDRNWNATEIFYGDGSPLHCDYWFLTEDGCLIHLNSIRDYTKEENAVYKSRYSSILYRPTLQKNKLAFIPEPVRKTKKELDNLTEIKKILNIPKTAADISSASE